MNVRLACNWLRSELIDRALHRQSTSDEQLAKEEAWWDAAVAEVDDWLDPPVLVAPVDPWSDPEWVAAMGGEVAGV